MRKKIIIAISVILAFIILAVVVTVPCLYSYGLLGGIHHMKTAKEGQIRIACVGDSLTYGYGVKNQPKNSYPAKLGALLGDEYCVNNYGYSGRTAGFKGDKPYTKEKLYRQSLDFAPQIVIIMLGSNDTKHKNWQGKESFKNDYRQIINSYLELDSVMKVYIMLPPPVFNINGKAPYGLDSSLIKTDLRDAIRELITELKLDSIDLYGIFEDKANLFKDGAHPNAEGAERIAREVMGTMFPGPPPGDND